MAARTWILLAAARQALAQASSSSSSSGSSSGSSSYGTTDVDNVLFETTILVILAILVLLVALHQAFLAGTRYIRKLTCLTNDKQLFFIRPVGWYGSLKQHLLYAPLVRTRHHSEMRLFGRVGMGILPTRFQSLLLTGIIAMNVTLAVYGIEWNELPSTNTLKHFRNRTGTMAVANMIPLFIMAGRNNPLITLLGISYDSFNLMHRWFGRICASLAVAHTAAFLANDVNTLGWAETAAGFSSSIVVMSGLIAMVAFAVIVIQTLAVIRHAFYEFFLHLHIALAVMSIVALWYHLDEASQQKIFLEVAMSLWIAERAYRMARMAYRNFGGRGSSRAVVEALPGDALRVTLNLARPWAFKPGQYFFITIPGVGLWTSHPFSAAWSEDTSVASDEKGLVMTRQDVLAQPKTTSISAIIRRRDGFTDSLFKRASGAPDGRTNLSAIVEGPYGLTASLSSYGTVLLFAGGVGITHQVPYVRSLITDFANGTGAARRVCLVWVIQSPEHLEWIRPWMTSILSLDRRRDILRIQLFVTRPRSAKEIQSPSSTVQMFPGRPNVDTLLGKEVEHQVGAMAVSVCGTGGLADDVRRAVRRRQGAANIDLIEESFSW